MRRPAAALLLSLLLPLFAAAPSGAQVTPEFGVRVAPNYRSFSLDDALVARSISLALLPVTVTVPVGRRFVLDAYGAYAQGSAETGDRTLELAGPVDMQVRGTWVATPGARVTFGVNLPTGNGTHSSEEAQVAALLATDLLGFREASFGTGLAFTTGVALAQQLGDWGVGVGASYRVNDEFEPSEESSIVYSPGDEIVARVAVDRNVGPGGKLTAGATYQHFSDDTHGENLFRPGARIRGDLSYSFRPAAGSTMTLYAVDLWREEGEMSLLTTPAAASPVGAQNVLILGAGMTMGGRLQLRPEADIRVLSHDAGRGSGWIGGIGLGAVLRAGGVALVPRARLMFGGIESDAGAAERVAGFELELSAGL